MLAGHSSAHPGYYIHTSGTGILCWKDMESQTYGEGPSSPAYDDLDDVSALANLPDQAFHRDVDKIVLAAGSEHAESLKTAIVCPPTIYGPGRGPGNKRSRQVYNLAAVTLRLGFAPQLGKGLTEWDNVHVHDLSELYKLLVEAAVWHKSSDDDELWGDKGYFLAENGHHVWGQVAKQVAVAAHKKGYLQSDEVRPMGVDEAKENGGFEALSWGLNSKGKAKRARKFLGWKPSGESLEKAIPEIVEGEAKLEGVGGHAKKAAGEI